MHITTADNPVTHRIIAKFAVSKLRGTLQTQSQAVLGRKSLQFLTKMTIKPQEEKWVKKNTLQKHFSSEITFTLNLCFQNQGNDKN